jgi:hypothetical protein
MCCVYPQLLGEEVHASAEDTACGRLTGRKEREHDQGKDAETHDKDHTQGMVCTRTLHTLSQTPPGSLGRSVPFYSVEGPKF